MQISDAFAQYGAKLKNVQWSVSAENAEEELVVSLWKHKFEKAIGKSIKYVDTVSRWSGHGNKEFRERIDKAYLEKQAVRVIIARTNDEEAVNDGKDASKLSNTFHVRPDWAGTVTLWDGDNFEIEFRQEK